MAERPEPEGAERRRDERVSAQLKVRFQGADSLAEAVRSYSSNLGTGGLCLAVQKQYRPTDTVQLVLEAGGKQMPIQAVVAWCRPGFIGVRFTPATAEHQETVRFVQKLMGESKKAAEPAKPAEPRPVKPFSE
jgi:hypothetical protein